MKIKFTHDEMETNVSEDMTPQEQSRQWVHNRLSCDATAPSVKQSAFLFFFLKKKLVSSPHVWK